MAKELSEVLHAHSDSIDSIVGGFTSKYQTILDRTVKLVTLQLNNKLDISGGLVSSSKNNQVIINSLDDTFMQQLDGNGYADLLESYIDSFNGQFVWFESVLDSINSELQYPLPFNGFERADKSEFEAYKIGSKDSIRDAVVRVATRAKQQATLSAGGMPAKDLTSYISTTLDTSVGQAETLASTSISSFYRTINDKGYKIIEDDLPGFEVRYNYDGPLDKITRPFCVKLERLSKTGKTWTRAEISKMSNGQLPNVLVTGGGFNCRHQFVISTRDLNSQYSKKGAPKKKSRKTERSDVEREILAKRAVHVKKFKLKTGVDHPAEQLQAIKQGVSDLIQGRRATR